MRSQSGQYSGHLFGDTEGSDVRQDPGTRGQSLNTVTAINYLSQDVVQDTSPFCIYIPRPHRVNLLFSILKYYLKN